MNDVFQIADWQKVSDLGSGAFGVVSLWKNVLTNDYIAIKKCKFHLPSNLSPKQKERWKKEVEIMKNINHQNIVSFVEIPSDLNKGLLKSNPTKLPLLSMEYCQKGNLRHLLQTPRNVCGLEEQEVRCILTDVASGLQYLHDLNITHRDIKPDNIVLQHCNKRKGNTIYKIIDLGYAKELNDSTVSFVGTLHYLAPEIFETVKYDSSVDYWSLGVMTFEVICGVVPFLPHQSPAERFTAIKKKEPDDICIYLNYSGQITYSTELKEEIMITTCFNQCVKEWLQHTLQFDPNERAKNFPNGTKPLEYLLQILSKRIIKVFVLHKLEIYSYEIESSTLVGTVKDWISRDIKVPKTDLIVLFRSGFVLPDEELMISVVDSDDYFFVIHRNGLIGYPVPYRFPKLIREVMKSALNFHSSYLWQLYSQTVYYITMERIRANLFRCGLQTYVSYLKQICEKLRKKYISVSKKLGNLLVRVDCCTFIRKNNVIHNSLFENKDYWDCLTYSGQLLEILQENLNCYRDFKTKIDKTFRRLSILISVWPEIVELVNDYNLAEQHNEVMHLLEKSGKGKNVTLLKSEITRLVSESIRLKETLFKNEKFSAFLSAMANVEKNVQYILLWLQEYDNNIQKLSVTYMENEVQYWNIRIQSALKSNKNATLHELNCGDDLSNFQSCELTNDNISLLDKFEKLLSESISEEVNTTVENIL